MREHTNFTREEYQLTKVALERSDVPAKALLSAWIEGEHLLVDDREDVGVSTFAGWMQGSSRCCLTSSPLSSPAVPTSAKPGTTPAGTSSTCSCIGIRRDSPDAQFIPVLAARSKAVEEINKRLDNDLGDN